MSSPFSNLEEFNGALEGPTEGAIYTFAHAPIFNNIALLASVGIFLWFMITTYSSHSKPLSVDRTLSKLSTFIVISLLSLVAADYRKSPGSGQQSFVASPAKTVRASQKATPLGLLGMAGMSIQAAGTSMFRKSKKRRKLRKVSQGLTL